MAKRILIDGDWLVYTAGFAGQKTEYVYELGGENWVRGDTLTELKEIVGPTFNTAAVFSRVVCDPIEHVLHTAKLMLTKAVDAVTERLHANSPNVTVFIDGDGNFRQKIATIKPYKGNRIAAKPVLYSTIREYLQEQWGAVLVHDQETDDALSIEAWADPDVVIVGVDKDLLQIPALHYNPNKGFCKVTPELGEALVYRQCLTGDVTDNIGGCYKAGPKRAHEVIRVTMFPEIKWAAVLKEYQASIDKYGEGLYNGLTAAEAAIENMRLVWLRHFPGEMWEPPAC